MKPENNYDVIIIGGSYAGLSAAMSLGRSLRKVLILDSGKPCNQQTPHSHNFITHDGETPAAIAMLAKEQVLAYDTVTFKTGLATKAEKTEAGAFIVTIADGETCNAEKLIFTTGMKDEMPAIKGFAECWGISVLHCPYCHGYEVKQQPTGILTNGDMAYELAKLINNWTNQLTIYTSGTPTLSAPQTEKLQGKKIRIVGKEIAELVHQNGRLETVLFTDGSSETAKALYARPAMKQHCDLPQQLGCELTEQGLIKINMMHQTSVEGVYAAGDCTTMMRSVALAVSGGNFAGASVNKDLIEERF